MPAYLILRRRVAALIDLLSEVTMGGDPAHVEVLCREDLAALVGLRVESISRVIADLRRKNILRPLGNGVYEYERDSLKIYSEQQLR